MAHFAQIDENNRVVQVIVINNAVITDSGGEEHEDLGVAFCSDMLGGDWKQTSYNGSFRKNFASVGFKYDTDRDAFIAPQPYVSWTLDEETCTWQAPVEYPNDGQIYIWNEETTSWEVRGE